MLEYEEVTQEKRDAITRGEWPFTEMYQPGQRRAEVHGYQPFGQREDANRQPDPHGEILITGWFPDEPLAGQPFPEWERRRVRFMRSTHALRPSR